MIKMKVDTFYKRALRKGEELDDIPVDVQTRWISNGIAELIPVEEPESEYDEFSTKDLFFQCKDLELKIDPARKKERDYLISLLEENKTKVVEVEEE